MNKVVLIGRLTKAPDVRYSTKQDGEQICISRYTLAVNRRSDGTDYISCVAFGKQGEFAEKYLNKGMKIAVAGRIQTGSYEKDGNKVYTTDVVVEEHEFAENKKDSSKPASTPESEGFINIPEDIENTLPWK